MARRGRVTDERPWWDTFPWWSLIILSVLGWMGKHSNLLTKEVGSYYFIAELILDLELPPDAPVTDHCGTCTACIDACPTQAITEPYVVDGSKCISYYTIELKSEIPASASGQWADWIFGCDICQDVCPWNRFATPHSEPRFNAHPELMEMTRADWEELTEEVFRQVFPKSAVKVYTEFSKDGTVTLKVDDTVVVEGQTPGPMLDMPVDGLEVGVDRNGAVGRYPADKLFEGTVKNISLKILK